MRPTAVPSALLLAALAIGAAGAATLDVYVHEVDGPATDNVVVILRPDDGDPFSLPAARGRTGLHGRVRLSDVPPGTYIVHLQGSFHPYLGHPALPGFGPPARVTLLDAGATVLVDIPLRRGFAFVARAALDGAGNLPRVRLRARDLDRALVVEQPLNDRGWLELLLPVGRWEVELEPEPGYLLVDLDRDGTALDGHRVLLDIERDSVTTGVTWVYRAPAHLDGRLTTIAGRPWNGPVEAVLLEAGPWLEQARARGGSVFERVTANGDIQRGGYYYMTLPDGSWRVQPVPETVSASDPEAVEMELAPGSAGHAEFIVTPSPGHGRGGSVLYVEVEDPGGRRASPAVVELWPLDDDTDVTELVARARTRPGRAIAELRDVPPGDYQVIAGHVKYRDGEATVSVRDEPGSGQPYRRVQLQSGASILAGPREGTAVTRDIVVEIAWLGELPPTAITDPTFIADKELREEPTGVNGLARVDGLEAGRWRVSARDSSGHRGRAIRVARGDDEPAESVDVELAEHGRIQVDLVVVEAGGLRAALVCSDEGPLPTAAHVRVGDERGEVVRALERPLTDRFYPEITIGGLAAGVYTLAVRPSRFDRWTWAPGIEGFDGQPADAARIDVEAGATADAGAIAIECGPRLWLTPHIASGAASPDLRAGEVSAALVLTNPPEAESTAGNSTPAATSLPHNIEQTTDTIVIGGFFAEAEAEVELTVTVGHAHFLPGPAVSVVRTMTVARGRVHPVALPIADVGGSLEVRSAPAPFARLTVGEEIRRLAEAEDGYLYIGNLPPGSYRLELCAERPCAEVVAAWDGIEIEPVIHRQLRPDDRDNSGSSEALSETLD